MRGARDIIRPTSELSYSIERVLTPVCIRSTRQAHDTHIHRIGRVNAGVHCKQSQLKVILSTYIYIYCELSHFWVLTWGINVSGPW